MGWLCHPYDQKRRIVRRPPLSPCHPLGNESRKVKGLTARTLSTDLRALSPAAYTGVQTASSGRFEVPSFITFPSRAESDSTRSLETGAGETHRPKTFQTTTSDTLACCRSPLWGSLAA